MKAFKTIILLVGLFITSSIYSQEQDYFYSVVRKENIDIKQEDLIKSNNNTYELTIDAYDRIQKQSRNVILLDNYDDLKKAKSFKRSQFSPSRYMIIKIYKNKLNISKAAPRTKSVNEYWYNYYDGMMLFYQFKRM